MAELDSCTSTVNGSLVVVKGENGKKATFTNAERKQYQRVRIDGCVIENGSGKAVDWLLRQSDHGDLLIELKGKNTDEAAKQIYATLESISTIIDERRSALVVSNRVPKASGTAQALQMKMIKNKKCKVRFLSGNRTFNFADFF
ncbi:MAG: hypothetical protein KKD64_09180 [Alphaproteobacteria bacterium]|nr:hypothetical protein [Alphaproteobacteria bacterium]MBU0793244.1 hypothetical protein [Alphaproteobacteria bacterium]MBU0874501.1 hypothetical protein [Alphaproteobacteria bacterium]MBU1769814.1 hypothetical protein [Alphaproteobacteria bacterium]